MMKTLARSLMFVAAVGLPAFAAAPAKGDKPAATKTSGTHKKRAKKAKAAAPAPDAPKDAAAPAK